VADYRPPLRDIFFVLDHLVDIGELCELDPFKHIDPDTVKGVIEESGRFMSEVIAPTNQAGDREGARHDPASGNVSLPEPLAQALRRYVEAGWGGVAFPPEYGGGGFPWLVGIVNQELVNSANVALAMAPLLTQSAIDMLLHHGDETQRELYLPKMVTGEWTGTMNLTEPEAGSDVGALRTRAVRQPDGTYRLTGTKIFISFGDHQVAENIVHLVLARTPDAPSGTKGISCFIVPKYLVNPDGSLGERNDVRVVSIEHKMGIKASPTCVMSYGDGPGAVGYLIGEEHQGMRYMFTMMNNARLSVGVEGLSIAERAYQDAVAYARQRHQGRAPGAPAGYKSPIIEHPDVRRMLLTMKALIEAMRALVYVQAEGIDLAAHHPDPDIRQYRQHQVDLLTPVAKAWCTDMGVEVTSLAIQVFGGMGYIEESGVPQHFRDARIMPIYEGTNGIQALDLVGRKLPMESGGVVAEFLSQIAMLDPALLRAGPELASIRSHLAESLTELADTTNWIYRNGVTDVRDAMAGATPYLRMFSLVVGGWLMAKSALAAKNRLEGRAPDGGKARTVELRQRAFLQAKLATAQFYCEQILPQTRGLVGAVRAGHQAVMRVPADQF
jgi:alkylation response protein AidB-like acyl-CoA dehydrogenase